MPSAREPSLKQPIAGAALMLAGLMFASWWLERQEAHSQATRPETRSSPSVVYTGPLYSDEEAERMAEGQVSEYATLPYGLREHPVFQHKGVRTLGEIFGALGVQQSRLQDFRESGCMNMHSCRWRVSESYDLICITGVHAVFARGGVRIAGDDPALSIHAIQFARRATGDAGAASTQSPD